jgi:hypothetical protein
MSASDIWPRSRISTMAVDQVRIGDAGRQLTVWQFYQDGPDTN